MEILTDQAHGQAHSQAVTGEFCYLAPESTVLRRFTAPGASVNTGVYRTHEMPVRNGRPVSDQFTLDRNGFALIEHASAVTDFTDKEEVDRVYIGEVAEFVRSYTGADRVATLGWTLRRSAAPGENASQPPDEGLDNRMYFVDTIPADLYQEMPPDAPGASGFEFHHRPGHRWWYFPAMTRDEILFFKLNDSDHTKAWRVPHSAFHDKTAAATNPRHSIEFRTIAYFA
jgi:hypothetical protein